MLVKFLRSGGILILLAAPLAANTKGPPCAKEDAAFDLSARVYRSFEKEHPNTWTPEEEAKARELLDKIARDRKRYCDCVKKHKIFPEPAECLDPNLGLAFAPPPPPPAPKTGTDSPSKPPSRETPQPKTTPPPIPPPSRSSAPPPPSGTTYCGKKVCDCKPPSVCPASSKCVCTKG